MDYELVIDVPTDDMESELPRSACGCGGGAGCGCSGCVTARAAQRSRPRRLPLLGQEPEVDSSSVENEMGGFDQEELENELRRRAVRRGGAQGRVMPPRPMPLGGRPPWPRPLPGFRPGWPVRPTALRPSVVLPWGSSARPVVCDCSTPSWPGSETVRWVQNTLNSVRGFNLPVTGTMTPMARSALRSFQVDEGLTPDGIAGPVTVRALEKYAAKPAPQLDPSPAAPTSDGPSDAEPAAEPQELEFEYGGNTCAPTAGASFRERVAAIANCEWLRWGKATIKDNQAAAHSLLMDYWMNYRPGRGSAQEAEEAIRKGYAWSAAFVSWVMAKAGAGTGFHYASFHSEYASAALNAARTGMADHYRAFDINQITPEVGDIICNDRKKGGLCAGTSLSNLKTGSGWNISHGDIVVEVHANRLVVIGGNVSDTVTRREIKLDSAGRVPQTSRDGCAYFAILKAPDTLAQPRVQPPMRQPSAGSRSTGVGEHTRTAVRLAQKIINLVLDEKLDVDGIPGPHTTTALKLFQCEKSMHRTGKLDNSTMLALAQVALEKIHQQSLFSQPGVMDENTKHFLSEFRRSRGLSSEAQLDTATLQALSQALRL